MNEQYLVRRTKYVASPFLQLNDVWFTETSLEVLSKTLVTVGLVQIDLLVLVARGVMLQPASYFLNLFLTRRQQIETSFFLLETIKFVHGMLLMLAIIIYGIFLL